VRSKSDISQLNLYHTEPTTKKWKKEKLTSKNGYIGKQCARIRGVTAEEEDEEGYGGKDLQKTKRF